MTHAEYLLLVLEQSRLEVERSSLKVIDYVSEQKFRELTLQIEPLEILLNLYDGVQRSLYNVGESRTKRQRIYWATKAVSDADLVTRSYMALVGVRKRKEDAEKQESQKKKYRS